MRHRSSLILAAGLVLAGLAAACSEPHNEQRAPMTTAPALDGSPPTTPPDTTSRGGPILGGGG